MVSRMLRPISLVLRLIASHFATLKKTDD